MGGDRRALILGMGVACPAGVGVDACWEGFAAGRSFAEVLEWPDVGVRAIGCRVDDAAIDEYVSTPERRRLDRVAHLAIIAADQAVRMSGLPKAPSALDHDRLAMVVGIGFGGISTLTAQHVVLQERGWRRLSPFAVPAVMPSSVAAVLAIRYGVAGGVSTVSSACASATQAIGDAARLLQSGAADIVITGGAEAPLDPLPVGGFQRMDAMSERYDEPAAASRPFDRDRDGFVIGEGAGFFVLGTAEAATALGSPIRGEVLGYGTTTDAHHITAPDDKGDGAARCIRLALAEAGLPLSELTHVNTHGTSTKLNDRAEAAAIVRCANGRPLPPTIALKSTIGHLMGGAGAVELAASLLASEHGSLPPTLNFTAPDEDTALPLSASAQRLAGPGPFLTTSFGFGGQNAALVVTTDVG